MVSIVIFALVRQLLGMFIVTQRGNAAALMLFRQNYDNYEKLLYDWVRQQICPYESHVCYVSTADLIPSPCF